MGLGGPVWHVSVAPQGTPFGRSTLWRRAEAELAGVGDAGLGEWREDGNKAVHLRRRLSDGEAMLVGPTIDVRGTHEAVVRAKALGEMIRYCPREILAEELGV